MCLATGPPVFAQTVDSSVLYAPEVTLWDNSTLAMYAANCLRGWPENDSNRSFHPTLMLNIDAK